LGDRPQVLLIGDSIRLAYQPLVAASLGDSVEISGPAVGCGDSRNLLDRLDDWVPPEPRLVLFNAGLHDIRRSGKDGRHQVEIASYTANLTAIVRGLRERGAAAVFLTTTPVDDLRHADAGKPDRLDADVQRYNEAARRVMEELEVPVVDLYALIGPTLIAADGVHLTAQGNAAVAGAVAATILDLL
jgi:lysophospholipase L1-like esterase